jgi:DNA-binding GntR family transcriptional regulator
MKEAIISGELAPGARLVEVQVAEQLGVSRTPVREALKRLLSEEYVSRDRLGGLVVHPVTQHEVEEAYFIRGGMDGLAAHLAAYRISPDELNRVRVIHKTMGDAVREGRTEEAAAANIAFHDAIYDIAGNRRLKDMACGLRDFVRRFSTEAFVALPDRPKQVLKEHGDILAALEANDPEAAEAAARRHLDEARVHSTELRVTEELLSSLEN